MRLRATAIGLLLFTGCGGEPTTSLVHLDVAAPADRSCVGVSGFELEVQVSGREPMLGQSFRIQPVLHPQDCTLGSGSTFADLPIDVPLDIEVRGYDGARQLRVHGTKHIDSVDGHDGSPIELKAAGLANLPVIAIENRVRDVLEGAPVASVVGLELSLQRGGDRFLVAVDESQRPYFNVGEPWAFAFPNFVVAGDELVSRATLTDSKMVIARLRLEDRGDYFAATPSTAASPSGN